MNELLGLFTDLTMVAAVTTASHFGLAIETTEPARTQAEARRAVRRTGVAAPSSKPAPYAVRTPAR